MSRLPGLAVMALLVGLAIGLARMLGVGRVYDCGTTAATRVSVTIRPDREHRAFAWIALALVLGSAIAVWPLVPWVVLAMWMAALARRVHRPMCRFFGDRPRLAAVLTMAILALFLGPAVALLTFLVADAIDLVQRLMASARTQEILRQLVSSSDGSSRSPSDIVGLVMSQGGRAWEVGQLIAGTAARMVIGLVTLIAGTYAILVDGDRWYVWVENHVPIPASALRRLAGAFIETGRGLIVGIGGAGLAQSIVATIVYASLGVPQALALGLLTLVFSVVPAIGTALVWIPVVAGLAVTGRGGAAVVLLIAGVAVIGTIDNLVRPYLARRGNLQLPTYVVLVAMFGGVLIMGGWGVLIAPLVVRLAKEAMSILRDERVASGGFPTTHLAGKVRHLPSVSRSARSARPGRRAALQGAHARRGRWHESSTSSAR